MIYITILLSTIYFASSDELNNNFKINVKDIIKFTRNDAKDVTREDDDDYDDDDKALKFNPIVGLHSSEVVNATLSQLLLRSPFQTFPTIVTGSPNLVNDVVTQKENPQYLITTKGLMNRFRGFKADQVVSPINFFSTIINNVENVERHNEPKVYFPEPLENERLRQIKNENVIGGTSLDLAANSEQGSFEDNVSIFARKGINDLSSPTLDLVGILNLNNYFSIAPTSSQQTSLTNDEPVVIIPKVVLPLEPHDSLEPQSVSDDNLFIQPKGIDEQYDYDKDDSLESEIIVDIQPEINLSNQEGSQSQVIEDAEPTYLNNQEVEFSATKSVQTQTDQTNSESNANFESSTTFKQVNVDPSTELKGETTKLQSPTLHPSRSSTINNLPEISPLPGELYRQNDNLPQKPKKLTWQAIQINKVNIIPNDNSKPDIKDLAFNLKEGSSNPTNNLASQTTTNNLPHFSLQPKQSPVITLQPPGMLPYFSPLPNKSAMVPPNFNQPINILPDINLLNLPGHPSQPVKWVQQSNKLVYRPAASNQQFNILEKSRNSENDQSQVYLTDFLPETSASTNFPSTKNKSVYTLKENRTITGNIPTHKDQVINIPPVVSKPFDTDFHSQKEQEILNYSIDESDLTDSQSQEQTITFFPEPPSTPEKEQLIIQSAIYPPQTQNILASSHQLDFNLYDLQEQTIPFFPEPSTPEKEQLIMQSVIYPSQSQNNLAASYQTVSLEQSLKNENTKTQIDDYVRQANTLIHSDELHIQPANVETFSLDTDDSEETIQISTHSKQVYGKSAEEIEVEPKECSASTIVQERFVTITVISKILETVREPISTSYVTIRDHQTFTRSVKVPYFTNTVTQYLENTKCPTRTYGTNYVPNTGVPLLLQPGASSYTDYFGDGNSKETLKMTLDRYENNYMDWVNKLKSRKFHIDKDGKPKNFMSLSYGEWPKGFVIDDKLWD